MLQKSIQTDCYLSDYELEIAKACAGDGLAAVCIEKQNNRDLYYILTDHLGSIQYVTNDAGTVVEEYSFDAWGRLRNPQNWTYNNLQTPTLLTRGFTGHEHLYEIGLINMNGRMYDPVVGRFLSADPFIQSPGNSQNYNRYSYCLNNPLSYTDPSGEFIFTALALIIPGGQAFLPMAIGADIGMWSGGSAANGTMNPFKWNYNSGKTWGYMAGGALVGGASGGFAGSIATSGMPMANTAAIMGSSYMNSVGMNVVTGGQTDVSISFGIGSFNMSTGQVRGLWNWGDLSTGEKIGYTLGAVSNFSDIMTLNSNNQGSVTLATEDIKSEEGRWYSHSMLKKNYNDPKIQDINIDITGGAKPDIIFGEGNLMDYPITDSYFTVEINRANTKILQNFSNRLNNGQGLIFSKIIYQVPFSDCVSHTAFALWCSGVPNFGGLHPYFLHAQMYLRSIGIRPSLFSYNFY